MRQVARVLNRIVLFISVVSHPALASESPEKISNAITVNADEAQNLYEQGAMFVDVRTRQEWAWGHVEGSYHLGLKSTFVLLYRENAIDHKTPIVIYGSGTHMVRATLASYLAVLWGYEKVYYFREGYFSWLARDMPVVMLSDKSIK
ncbi:MAG: rhodanese-like domain-containing protein [Endozoicomonadaceae bacterium]|nr:rhodanese-like domain-containing protein [Endozoicomonadaceae bacterium]